MKDFPDPIRQEPDITNEYQNKQQEPVGTAMAIAWIVALLFFILIAFILPKKCKGDTCDYLGGDINSPSSWSCNKAPTYEDTVIVSQPLVLVDESEVFWGNLIINSELRLVRTNLDVSQVDCNGTLYVYPDSGLLVRNRLKIEPYSFLFLYPLGRVSCDSLYNNGLISKIVAGEGTGILRYTTATYSGQISNVILMPNSVTLGDINGDGIVNNKDLAIVAERWLE